MAGESQEIPDTGMPDPSVLTTEQMLRAITNLEKLTSADLTNFSSNVAIQFRAWEREFDLRESHRKELKEDSRTFTEAIRVSQETAVNAALAAAEKARDKESIAQQTSNDKTAENFAELLQSQGNRFSADIHNTVEGVNEVKTLIGELRAERRGGKEVIGAIYGFAGFLLAILLIGGLLAATGAFSK